MSEHHRIVLTSDGLWDYSLVHYPKVQQLLLNLQDNYQLNVNLFLLCGYAQQQGCAIDELQLSSLLSHCQQWQQQLISPFRALIRELKSQLSSEQYQSMLAMELSLERQQQQQLVSCLPELPTDNPEAQANILSCLIFSGVALESLSSEQLASLMMLNQK